MCGLTIPGGLQGKDITPIFDDPTAKVRDAVLSSGKGQLYRNDRWALLSYGKNGELYDMYKDPRQYTNLYNNPEYASVLADMKAKLKVKLAEISQHDLPKPTGGKNGK
jgi:iduronate 2-sulfatase